MWWRNTMILLMPPKQRNSLPTAQFYHIPGTRRHLVWRHPLSSTSNPRIPLWLGDGFMHTLFHWYLSLASLAISYQCMCLRHDHYVYYQEVCIYQLWVLRTWLCYWCIFCLSGYSKGYPTGQEITGWQSSICIMFARSFSMLATRLGKYINTIS